MNDPIETIIAPMIWVVLDEQEYPEYNLITITSAMSLHDRNTVLLKVTEIAYDIEAGIPFPTEANPAMSSSIQRFDGYFLTKTQTGTGRPVYKMVSRYGKDDV